MRHHPAATVSTADPRAVVEGPHFRLTVLTSRLVRLEHSADGQFEDRPTQLVRHRRFEVPEFTVRDVDGLLELWTDHLHVQYDKRAFSPSGLSITMRRRAQDSHFTTWIYGDPEWGSGSRPANLGGTARTLDDVDGAAALNPGLLSRDGYAVVDDSASLALGDDGWPVARVGGDDLYFFGYGRDFSDALDDYFTLTGPSPMLPRWTLGNWWSRFHDYTADDYTALMDRFDEAGIPFSVAVVDMDWHLVDIDPALGTGWTGYTWNRDLFPDPAAFLASLHDRHLRVALNVHPADGVRRHEDAYPALAEELGINPESGTPIAFDISSRDFAAAYLRHLHHPQEEIGVDFWWLDWQSGASSRVPGLDPLWALNDVHYRDSARAGNRPLTFSRYAGLGSHRTPIGFSGDTVATWESLAFQPYFTSTAANVGYFWWSHDIGGHFGGARDDEMSVRWYQFGVFSPINRLHSSKSRFGSKEPWRFSPDAEQAMTAALRLRHQLVPYLYTAMWRAHTDGVGPVRPMYHDHPREPRAYETPDQYLFGPDLVVAPVLAPVDPVTRLASTTVWLPAGEWRDFFTGRRYQGGLRLVVHRGINEIPVFAKAGAVVVLAADEMADPGEAPDSLVARIYPGADGECELFEDDGRADPSVADRWEMIVSHRWAVGETAEDDGVGRGDGTGEISPHEAWDCAVRFAATAGRAGLQRRQLRIEIVGMQHARGASVRGPDGVRVAVEPADRPGVVVVDLGQIDLTEDLEVEVTGLRAVDDSTGSTFFPIIDEARIEHQLKSRLMDLAATLSGTALVAALHALDLPGNLFGALVEQVVSGEHTDV